MTIVTQIQAMRWSQVFTLGTLGGATILLLSQGMLISAISWILVLLFGVIGFILGVALVLSSGKRYRPAPYNKGPRVANLLFTKMMVCKLLVYPNLLKEKVVD